LCRKKFLIGWIAGCQAETNPDPVLFVVGAVTAASSLFVLFILSNLIYLVSDNKGGPNAI